MRAGTRSELRGTRSGTSSWVTWRSPASAWARWACPTATPAPAPTTRSPSAPSTGPWSWASPSSTPPRSTARTPTRSSLGRALKGRRDEVVLATKFGLISHAGDGAVAPRQQPGQHPHRRRGLAEAAGHRPHRPVLPAPRRPEHADRGDRRRAGRAGRRGQDPPHRPVRGRPGHHPPRARRPPDHRAAVGVLAVDPRPRGARSCRCCASWASASCRTHRSGAAS